MFERLKKSYIRKSMDIAAQYVKANYKLETKIVAGSSAPYNYKCHLNSFNEANIHKDWKIFGCYQLNNGSVIAHFINWSPKKGYIETTQGQVGINSYYYYIVREFDKEEYSRGSDVPLEVLKENLFNMSFQNKFLNKFFKLNPYDYF